MKLPSFCKDPNIHSTCPLYMTAQIVLEQFQLDTGYCSQTNHVVNKKQYGNLVTYYHPLFAGVEQWFSTFSSCDPCNIIFELGNPHPNKHLLGL